MRSRVAGAFSTVNYGIRPAGAVVGGLLGGWLGVRETLLVSAAGGMLAVLWLIRSPILAVRDIDPLTPPANLIADDLQDRGGIMRAVGRSGSGGRSRPGRSVP
jgi:hypothetical protein